MMKLIENDDVRFLSCFNYSRYFENISKY